MQVFVTARGDSYHSTPECSQIVAGQEAARRNGNQVHPPRKMSLEEAQDWKPVSGCPRCWNGAESHQDYVVDLDVVEVRYEIGFGHAASTAKGFLMIPRSHWLAILPEDREDRVIELIKQQAAEQLRVSYRIVE